VNGKRQKQAVLSSLRPELILAFLFGVIFCSVLAYAGLRKEPITTDSGQFFFLRVLAALSAAGVASVIPGFLHVQLSPARILQLRAGGALAVFAIVYFVNPPLFVTPKGLPPDKQVIADILAHLTPKLHWNRPVLEEAWSHSTEPGEANRRYEITSQLADDNFKHYHRGTAIYKLFGNDEWHFNRLFVPEDSIRLLDGPPPSAEYLKKVVMDAGRELRTLPFLWDTVWVYEIRIPEDPHFERISKNEFIFDAVIVCDQRSGSEIITEERRYTFRRYPVGLLINTGLHTKKIHQRKINPGESVRLVRDLPGRIDDAYGPD
jgi:hypothetical protein